MKKFIYSCSPKIIVNTVNKLEETKQHEGFAVFGINDTFDTTGGKYLGEIKIKDSGLTIDCNYENAIKLGEAEARKLGGNTLKVIVHKLPDIFSQCHQITGSVYKLSDISKYEKKIIWNENRKLKQIDF